MIKKFDYNLICCDERLELETAWRRVAGAGPLQLNSVKVWRLSNHEKIIIPACEMVRCGDWSVAWPGLARLLATRLLTGGWHTSAHQAATRPRPRPWPWTAAAWTLWTLATRWTPGDQGRWHGAGREGRGSGSGEAPAHLRRHVALSALSLSV